MFPLKNLARKGLISVQYVKGYYIKLIDRLQKKKKKKKIDRLRLTSVSTKKGHDITWTPHYYIKALYLVQQTPTMLRRVLWQNHIQTGTRK